MTDLEFLSKLIIKTNKHLDLWTAVDTQAYTCPFGKDKITFSFEFAEDEDEKENRKPEIFLMVFTNPGQGHYKQIIAYGYEVTNNPVVDAFQSLYRAVKDNEERVFLNTCESFFREEDNA